MKKVLFVAPSLTVGGMERVMAALADKLVQNEYDVTIMLLDTDDALKEELDPRVRVIKKPYKDHFGRNIPYIRHKLYDDGMWETRAAPEKLYRYYIGDEKYDVEIAFFRGLCVKIVSGSSNKDAAHFAWVHNDFRRAKGYQNNFSDMRQVFEAYSRFDKVVCVSKEAKDGFVETIGDTDNLTIIYNMLPVEKIIDRAKEDAPLGISRGKLHLVLVARMEDKAKGQLRLISAVSKLRSQGEDITLALVGGGQDEQRIREEIQKRGASDYIEALGEKKNPYPYIKDADLLVCASYYEGFNLTVAEALILGTPVLSTRCTGPCEILDNGAYGMIVENSEEGLYQGLQAFCADPDLLKKYREKAKERQDFFDEEKILMQIEKLWERKETDETDGYRNSL